MDNNQNAATHHLLVTTRSRENSIGTRQSTGALINNYSSTQSGETTDKVSTEPIKSDHTHTSRHRISRTTENGHAGSGPLVHRELDYSPPSTATSKRNHNANSDNTPKTASSRGSSRQYGSWTDSDITQFFEGVQEYGKDFAAISHYMTFSKKKTSTSRKEVSTSASGSSTSATLTVAPSASDPSSALSSNTASVVSTNHLQQSSSQSSHHGKSRDQVRFFFRRILNKITKILNDLTAGHGIDMKDAELYGVINYGIVWKRCPRVIESSRFESNLKELITTGQVAVRIKGKNYRLRTPDCNALRRLNDIPAKESNKDVIKPSSISTTSFKPVHVDHVKVPSSSSSQGGEINVQILPATQKDFYAVQSLGHNPRVRMTNIALDQRISSIIGYLEKKWSGQRNATLSNNCDPHADHSDHSDRSSAGMMMSLKLFPGRNIDLHKDKTIFLEKINPSTSAQVSSPSTSSEQHPLNNHQLTSSANHKPSHGDVNGDTHGGGKSSDISFSAFLRRKQDTTSGGTSKRKHRKSDGDQPEPSVEDKEQQPDKDESDAKKRQALFDEAMETVSQMSSTSSTAMPIKRAERAIFKLNKFLEEVKSPDRQKHEHTSSSLLEKANKKGLENKISPPAPQDVSLPVPPPNATLAQWLCGAAVADEEDENKDQRDRHDAETEHITEAYDNSASDEGEEELMDVSFEDRGNSELAPIQVDSGLLTEGITRLTAHSLTVGHIFLMQKNLNTTLQLEYRWEQPIKEEEVDEEDMTLGCDAKKYHSKDNAVTCGLIKRLFNAASLSKEAISKKSKDKAQHSKPKMSHTSDNVYDMPDESAKAVQAPTIPTYRKQAQAAEPTQPYSIIATGTPPLGSLTAPTIQITPVSNNAGNVITEHPRSVQQQPSFSKNTPKSSFPVPSGPAPRRVVPKPVPSSHSHSNGNRSTPVDVANVLRAEKELLSLGKFTRRTRKPNPLPPRVITPRTIAPRSSPPSSTPHLQIQPQYIQLVTSPISEQVPVLHVINTSQATSPGGGFVPSATSQALTILPSLTVQHPVTSYAVVTHHQQQPRSTSVSTITTSINSGVTLLTSVGSNFATHHHSHHSRNSSSPPPTLRRQTNHHQHHHTHESLEIPSSLLPKSNSPDLCWLNGESNDISLGTLFNSSESPMKLAGPAANLISAPSNALLDVSSLISDNSVDLMGKFQDLSRSSSSGHASTSCTSTLSGRQQQHHTSSAGHVS